MNSTNGPPVDIGGEAGGAAMAGVAGGCLGALTGLIFLSFLPAVGLSMIACILFAVLAFAVVFAKPYLRWRAQKRADQ